ncbi:MAG: helix-turn-helix transcriptional regulator [Rhodobiaceae bacterium]|nr:helix-turn-helix transcriptional regulator [Rhodobiaceae bacterium]
MTLQQVADIVRTTPQTVQRLETANMTVSMDWLRRLASAFGVPPATLIADDANRAIPLLGRIGREGAGTCTRDMAKNDLMTFDIAAEDPVAVQLEADIGDYAAGSYLIGNRLFGADIVNAHGADCIVMTRNGRILLRRLLWRDGGISLVPLAPSGDVRFDAEIEWAARVIIQLRYF